MKPKPLISFSTIAVTVFVAVVVWMGFCVRDAGREARASAAQIPLDMLHRALLNYHEEYGTFPPAYVADAHGQPMHSWRTLILPYVDCQKEFEQYDFSEAWDGPNNSKLSLRMSSSFHSATEPPSNCFTNVVAITGPGTVFPGAECTRKRDITDGQKNTILLVEITNSQIPWLAPVDLPAEEAIAAWNTPQQPGISAVSWRRPFVCFGERIRNFSLSRTLTKENLRAMITIAGGEPVTQDQLIQKGQIRLGAWIE